MSNDDWLKNLQSMRSEEKKVEDSAEAEKKAWEDLREKHKEERQKIMELLNVELKKVVDVFDNPSLEKLERPTVEDSGNSVSLKMPIRDGGTYIDLHISFFPHLTMNGYGLEIYEQSYDHVQEKHFERKTSIQPSIDAKKIQDRVANFLNDRKWLMERFAEKQKRYRQEWG